MIETKTVLHRIWREKYLLGMLTSWSALILLSAGWNLFQNHQEILKRAKIEANSIFQHTMAYQRWMSDHGGMYVVVSEKNKPNPFLKIASRDIHSTEGQVLTLISPFQMKTEVYHGYRELRVLNRSVSLAPLNPENYPDPWEENNLKAFVNGTDEIFQISDIQAKSFMRLMRPFEATERCFKCHDVTDGGNKNILGATSVSVPMEPYYKSAISTWWTILITHLIMLTLGGIIITRFYMGCRSYQKTISESEKKFRIVSEFAYNFEYWTTEENEIIFISPSCERITGYSQNEFLHEPSLIENIIHPDERDAFRNHLEHFQSPAHDDIDFRIITKKGETRWLSHTCRPIFIDGQFLGRRSSNKDVTEKKKLVAELLQAQKMECLGHFAGGIAHDFNNVLTSIVTFTHLLHDEVDENNLEIQDYIKHIIISAKLGKNLTSNLLSFGQRQIISPKKTSLNKIVRNISDIIKVLLPRHITWEMDLSEDEEPIFADPHHIEQILINLCTNAKDAMTNGGSLTIATRLVKLDREYNGPISPIFPGRYMILSVADKGEGISAADISRLCEPFYTTKEKKKGTGLGLSIIARIAKEHNGYLDVESEVGQGTTFEIYLPVMKERPQKEMRLPLPVEVAGHSATPTILLADDDKLIRKSISAALKQKGIKVLAANDGAEAISIYLDNRRAIDLALLDVVMPKKNGWEVYDILRKDRPDLKAIFISGDTDNIITNKIIAEENLLFMAKPLDVKILQKKVMEILLDRMEIPAQGKN